MHVGHHDELDLLPAAGAADPVPVDPIGVDAADSTEIAHLRRALEHRGVIGTAVGILAERYGCTTDQAFSLLVRLSSHSNVKVREVARLFVAAADDLLTVEEEARMATIVEQLPARR
jgi:hypothetical protein